MGATTGKSLAACVHGNGTTPRVRACGGPVWAYARAAEPSPHLSRNRNRTTEPSGGPAALPDRLLPTEPGRDHARLAGTGLARWVPYPASEAPTGRT